MKIELIVDVPVDPRHKMIKGRVLEVIKYHPHIYKKRVSEYVWVMGDREKVKILGNEFKIIEP